MAEDVIQFPEQEEQNILDMLVNMLPNLDGLQALTAVLDLPDREFDSFMPIVLEELEKGFNNSNDKYNLALALNMSGKTNAELRQLFTAVIETIDTEFEQYDEKRKGFLKQVIGMLMNCLERGTGLHERIIQIPIQLCHENAKMPTYAHDGDAGCDVYALDDYTIEPHQTIIIPLGFKVAVPAGYELQLRARSGMSARTKLRLANGVGTIDSGFRGEVGVIFDNISERPCYISKGQRIAQMVLSAVPVASFYEVDSVEAYESSRGEGGYGSSGR